MEDRGSDEQITKHRGSLSECAEEWDAPTVGPAPAPPRAGVEVEVEVEVEAEAGAARAVATRMRRFSSEAFPLTHLLTT